MWATLKILWKAVQVSSHLCLWPTGSEWHCTFCERQSHHIFSCDQQYVSDIAHFVKGSLITYFPMINSLWVTLHILWKAVSSHLFLWPTACEWHCTFCERQSSHLFLWPTGSEWHCTFCERQSHHIFSYDQQRVSDIAHFVKGSLITSLPMANREWVTLHILWKAVSSHLFLWPTVCEWHCTFCERQSHHIYDQQDVSEIAHFVKGSLITSFPVTGCEWHCTFCERQSHYIFSYGQQQVSDIAHSVKGSLITSFPMTNSQWVTLHILWNAVFTSFPMTNSKWVTLHLLWKAVFTYDQQFVSDIAQFVKGDLMTSFPMTNSEWVTLDILWKIVSSHLFLWPTGCEWHCTFCERQSLLKLGGMIPSAQRSDTLE